MSESTQKYSADSIQALEGMEHVRMRPSMYICTSELFLIKSIIFFE